MYYFEKTVIKMAHDTASINIFERLFFLVVGGGGGTIFMREIPGIICMFPVENHCI